MNEHTEVLVVYCLDELKQDLDVVGIFTHQDEAEACKQAQASAVIVPMTMAQALATVRHDAVAAQQELLKRRLDRMTERLGQLTAVIAAQQVAA